MFTKSRHLKRNFFLVLRFFSVLKGHAFSSRLLSSSSQPLLFLLLSVPPLLLSPLRSLLSSFLLLFCCRRFRCRCGLLVAAGCCF